MTTYPPAPLAYQIAQLLQNQNSQIAYIGHEGTRFHLSGPLEPVPGAQDGVNALDITGLDAPFRHLDNKGARQDGTTWYDALYDPAEIRFTAELSGMSPSAIRKVIGAWWGAWDPLKLGKLCWFSPERGEWTCDVRLAKNVQDQFKQDWYQGGKVRFNWIARNDNAFWQGVDSVCVYGNSSNVVVDDFGRTSTTDLGANWNQTYTGAGVCATGSGTTAAWIPSGSANGSVINRYIGNGSESSNGFSGNDHQTVSFTLATDMPTTAGTFIDLWGRMDTAGLNGVRARLTYNTATLSFLVGGVLTQVWSGPTTKNLKAGDVLSLQCGITEPAPPPTNIITNFIGGLIDGVFGVVNNLLGGLITGPNRKPSQFQVYQNGAPLIMATGTGILGSIVADIERFFGLGYGYTDSANASAMGLAYRGWGFGMSAAGNGTTQVVPSAISSWSGGSDTGFIRLSNSGDQPGWPRYLLYGPGTFILGDVASDTLVSFGPLLPGQVVLLPTLPRLQNVVDVTPGNAVVPSGAPSGVLGILQNIINFVTNNNVPPLIQQFESLFGVLPPQGVLYSLLHGRFTTPIPAMLEQVGPTTVEIPVQIQGGNDQSKIIAAVTPQRRWPE